MALWLSRAGRHGEHEQKFLDDNRTYITWKKLNCDLQRVESKRALQDVLHELYPDEERAHIINNSGQLWPFAHEMKPGDWVMVPSKLKPAIHTAEITGPYVYNPNADG